MLYQEIRERVTVDEMQFGFLTWQRNDKCDIHRMTDAEVSGEEKRVVDGFCGPREGFR